jgi:hypothetical protein
MKDSLDALITRTRRSFYDDGLWELMAGCISLCGGLLLQISPYGDSGAMVFGASVLLSFVLYSVAKNNLVYPRSGFAVYKGQGYRAFIIMIIKRAVLLVAISGIFLTLRAQNIITAQTWLVFLLSIFIGVGWLWQGIRLSMPRLLLLGGISLLLGAVLSPLLGWAAAQTMSTFNRISWYFVILGAAFLVSGGITFLHYLRSPWQEGDETT